MSAEQDLDNEKAAKALAITAPPSGEAFVGWTVSGTYSPISVTPPVITVYFWKNVAPSIDPDTSTADLHVVAAPDTPVGGMWKATFSTPPSGSGTRGYIRVVKSSDPTNPQNSRDLTWPVGGLTAPGPTAAKRQPTGTSTPQVLIQQPEYPDEVPRFFLAYGLFNSGDGNTVSVRLFRPDGTEAVATILSPEYPHGIQWLTAVLTYEGGIGYRLQARLIGGDGAPIGAPVSTALAID